MFGFKTPPIFEVLISPKYRNFKLKHLLFTKKKKKHQVGFHFSREKNHGKNRPWRNCFLLKKLFLKKAVQYLPGRHRHTVDGNQISGDHSPVEVGNLSQVFRRFFFMIFQGREPRISGCHQQ